ncbi:MAG: metal-binding protein [Alkalinema sp. CACIAM 70d]|nr:MAG: metal-binding protein [Alkalinema sp. CACIAM 70d]
MTQANARLVLNHSTHIPGLIPLLEKLSQETGIQSITPGAICPVRAHMPQLRLRVSVPIRGGYKLIARAGKIAQEVFVLTTLGQNDLEVAISKLLQR